MDLPAFQLLFAQIQDQLRDQIPEAVDDLVDGETNLVRLIKAYMEVNQHLEEKEPVYELIRELVRRGANSDVRTREGLPLIDIIDINIQKILFPRLWKGFTKDDILSFTQIITGVDRGGNNKKLDSFCPICLQFTLNGEGCNSVRHRCSDLSKTHPLDLFRKYATRVREEALPNVEWCRECNRIQTDHCHHRLIEFKYRNPRTIPLFEWHADGTCATLAVGGGGRREKIARCLALIRVAIRLQRQVGISNEVVVKRVLVAQTWDSVLGDEVGEENLREADVILNHMDVDIRNYLNSLREVFPAGAMPAEPAAARVAAYAVPCFDELLAYHAKMETLLNLLASEGTEEDIRVAREEAQESYEDYQDCVPPPSPPSGGNRTTRSNSKSKSKSKSKRNRKTRRFRR